MSGKQQYQEIPAVELNIMEPSKDAKSSRDDAKERLTSHEVKERMVQSKRASSKKGGVSAEQLVQYRELFRKFDRDDSGSIDLEELNDMLKTCGMQMDPADLREIVDEYDEDNNGTIDFQEFVQIFVQLVETSSIAQEQLSLQSSEPLMMESMPKLTESVDQDLAESQSPNQEKDAPIELAEDQLQTKEVKVKKAKPPPPKPKLLHIPGRAYMFDQGFSAENLKDHVEDVHHFKTDIEEVEVEEEIEEADPDAADAPAPAAAEEPPVPPLMKKKVETKKIKVKVKSRYPCCKTTLGQLAFGKDARQLTDLEKEMGPGLTIYFRQIKMLMSVFFIFSLAAIPQLAIFKYGSTSALIEAEQAKAIEPLPFLSSWVFPIWIRNSLFELSMANLAQSDFPCESISIKDVNPLVYGRGPLKIKDAVINDKGDVVSPAEWKIFQNITKIGIQCRHGQIKHLIDFGLSTWDSQCPSVNMDQVYYYERLLQDMSTDEKCNYRNLDPKGPEFAAINAEFKKVVGKSQALFNLNIKTMFTPYCFDRIKKLNYFIENIESFDWHPKIIISTQCVEEHFINPFKFGEKKAVDLSRKQLLFITAVTDIGIAFLFMLFIIFIAKISDRAIKEFKDFDNALETRDFAVQITNLPSVREYKNEQVLKSLLWQHFEKVVKEQPQQIKCLEKTQKYQEQIIDIFFGKCNYGPIMRLVEMKEQYQRVAYLATRAKNTGENLDKKIIQIEKSIEKKKQKYIKEQNSFHEKMENQLYSNKAIPENIEIAFVIFRSMEGRERALHAYTIKRTFTQKLRYCLCRTRKADEREIPLFMGKHKLVVEAACDSNHVNWNSFGQTKCKSCCSTFYHYLVNFFLILVGCYLFWGINYGKNILLDRYPNHEMQNMNPRYLSQLLTEQESLTDYEGRYVKFVTGGKDYRIKYGLMGAYCAQQMAGHKEYPPANSGIAPHAYAPQKEPPLNDQRRPRKSPAEVKFADGIDHCWLVNLQNIVLAAVDILTPILIALLNQFAISCFKRVSKSQRKRTSEDQHIYEVNSSIFIMFFNTVFIVFLANIQFNFIKELMTQKIKFLKDIHPIFTAETSLEHLIDYLPMFNGSLVEISAGWYYEVGRVICMILLAHVLIFQAKKLFQVCCFRCRICCDRRLARRKNKLTKEATQLDWNSLNTGKEFDVTLNYSSMHIVSWVTMCFSTSMPVLYLIAFLYYFLTYHVDKYLVVNYYSKSKSFNEQIPIKSFNLFKWPILFHLIFSMITFSDGQMFFNSDFDPKELGLNHIGLNIGQASPTGARGASEETKATYEDQPQDVVNTLLEKYHSGSFLARFGKLHLIAIYFFWLAVAVIYNLQDKVQAGCAAFCAKCRGDDEFQYDSEDDEAEDDAEQECQKCAARILEKQQRLEQVREFAGIKDFKDNNQIDKNIEMQKQIAIKANESSVEEEDNLDMAWMQQDEGLSLEELEAMGHYSDDFFVEVSVEYLIYYYERNNQELHRTIGTLTNNVYFDVNINSRFGKRNSCCSCNRRKLGTYVGVVFTQKEMKEMVGIYKKRRSTFKRRLMKVMKNINPKISSYFQQMASERQAVDPFQEQLELLKQILFKKLDKYETSKDVDYSQSYKLEVNAIDQKKRLIAWQSKCRIKSEIQSYDFKDQLVYQGVQNLQELYNDEVKSEFTNYVLREFLDSQERQDTEDEEETDNERISGSQRGSDRKSGQSVKQPSQKSKGSSQKSALDKSNADLSILKKYLEKSAEKAGEPSGRARAADSPERAMRRRQTLLARQHISKGLSSYIQEHGSAHKDDSSNNGVTPATTPVPAEAEQKPSTAAPEDARQILIIDEAYDQDMDKPADAAFDEAKQTSSLKKKKTRSSRGSAKKRKTKDSGC